MPDYIIKSDAKQTSTLGKVKVLVEQVVGAPSQEAINAAVAAYIEAHPGSLSPLSPAVKSALLQIAEKVAYIDEHGEDYYDALDAALNAIALLSITAVYTQSGTVYDTDSLDSLKSDLVVTAYYDDGTTVDVTSACTLSGTLTEGTSTITATYQEKTATFEVIVSEEVAIESWIIGKGFDGSNGAEITVTEATTSAPRAIYVGDRLIDGGDPFRHQGASGTATIYYPIVIPDGATGVTVTNTGSGYESIYGIYYNGSKWMRIASSGWQTTYTYTFPSGSTHWAMSMKHASAGTAAVTQEDVDAVSWEYVY